MSEVNTKLKYNNILHDITYEIYVNGEIKLINYNNSLKDDYGKVVDCFCSSSNITPSPNGLKYPSNWNLEQLNMYQVPFSSIPREWIFGLSR